MPNIDWFIIMRPNICKSTKYTTRSASRDRFPYILAAASNMDSRRTQRTSQFGTRVRSNFTRPCTMWSYGLLHNALTAIARECRGIRDTCNCACRSHEQSDAVMSLGKKTNKKNATYVVWFSMQHPLQSVRPQPVPPQLSASSDSIASSHTFRRRGVKFWGPVTALG